MLSGRIAEISTAISLGKLSSSSTSVNTWASISGTNVVWAGYDGHDYEIYIAKNVAPIPAPSALLLGFLGLGVANWKLRKQRC